MSYSRRDLLRHAAGAVAALALPRSSWAWTSTSNVDVARKAERWIRRSRIKTDNGITWPADPLQSEKIDRAFYNGTPGIVLFLLESHHATGDERVLAEARLGADDLVASVPTYEDAGLYTGLAGTAYVLAEVHRATGEKKYLEASRHAARRIQELPMPESTDIISGSAGIGLFLLWSGADATAHGRHLVEAGRPEHGGLKWAISPKITNLYPNFSHGTAGVSYFLATLYGRTREQSFLDAALAGVRYLDAVAVRQANGYTVFHHEPGGTDLFYLSWCHGPVGTARLFYRLWKVTGDAMWLDRVHQCARGIMNAGVGSFFVALCGLERRPEYERMVERCEADLLRRATVDGDGMKWIQAEHRVRPELLVAQTGFMQGAAGIGTFFLHADGMRRGRKAFVRMPDSPFE